MVQGYYLLPPTPRACAPPTVAEGKKLHASHGMRVLKMEKASLGDCTQRFSERPGREKRKPIGTIRPVMGGGKTAKWLAEFELGVKRRLCTFCSLSPPLPLPLPLPIPLPLSHPQSPLERACLVTLDSSGAAPVQPQSFGTFFARAASNRAFQRQRLVAFRLFRSRPRALGPFRARRIQQSLPERALKQFRSRSRALAHFRARRIQQSLPEKAFSGV